MPNDTSDATTSGSRSAPCSSRFIKLRIASDGTPAGTRVVDAITGEDLGSRLGVAKVAYDAHGGGRPYWSLELSPAIEVEYQPICLHAPGPFKLLPKVDWQLQLSGGDVLAAIWEFPPELKVWMVIDVADLPNDLIGIEDLRRFGISLIEGRAVSL